MSERDQHTGTWRKWAGCSEQRKLVKKNLIGIFRKMRKDVASLKQMIKW